ncbi:thioredoxin family protein [Methanosalsum natronophilum]|uniref:Thioredoxin n=1 Tax=Methanosalsum natronophilum TaxID=768733 RepID=A0A3R7XPI9_9EURY|nr:thioredoxin family protein [Methanosalsum natronophilum]MCS3923737.1 small redox-active disulfide protein 2 [Methanosalsum natronophilum]RQD80416.1 MAG: thioredoxin family protein [Methanosalsum natronophilum]
MKIEILGTGCAKCKMVLENVEKAVNSVGVDADIKKIEDINDIMGYGVMVTPAVVIDGEVKVSGKVPSEDEIKSWLTV